MDGPTRMVLVMVTSKGRLIFIISQAKLRGSIESLNVIINGMTSRNEDSIIITLDQLIRARDKLEVIYEKNRHGY